MTEQPVPEPVSIEATADGAARIRWVDSLSEGSLREAIGAVSAGVETALREHHRVEAFVPVEDETGQRIATWAGLRREGVRRDAGGDRVVLARLRDDPPLSDGNGFRAMLNSFLPRKRAIGQMLVRDADDRVLMCRLTYKKDWDLPGGVVEVGESPRLATSRELAEELGIDVTAGTLLLTDWLPSWSGWDDAICLVFDGGQHDPSIVESMVFEEREIRDAAFLTLDEIAERSADFTHRRVAATLANLAGRGQLDASGSDGPSPGTVGGRGSVGGGADLDGSAYTESGRP